jgi:hypothetical protein
VDISSDARTIGRSNRDPSAFATMFDRHAPVLHGDLCRRVGLDDADDLVSETFVIASKRCTQATVEVGDHIHLHKATPCPRPVRPLGRRPVGRSRSLAPGQRSSPSSVDEPVRPPPRFAVGI